MQNINPTQSRSRRALFYIGIIGLPVLFGGCIAAASVVLLSQLPLLGSSNTLGMVCLGILSIPAIIGGAIATYRGMTLERDNRVAYDVGEYLRNYLGQEYVFLRNVSRRGLGYIDAVLIGPPGVLIFRTVSYTGKWRNERANWWVEGKNGRWKSASDNPSRECARDVYALRKYFAKNNLSNVPVYGIVVFTNPSAVIQGEPNSVVVPISKVDRLYEVMQRDYLAEPNRIQPKQAQTARQLIER